MVAVPSTSTAPYTFNRAPQGQQASCSPPPPLPLQVQSLVTKVTRGVQTSLTWLNNTPLWVPEWHAPKQDREMQTFCTWIPLGWRK